ncbi:hypothetical protein [Thioalkalivibrio sp. HK1]|uniref:hypothetical protein n=1 Tax=Thioalkalivibrio sp. HK1 TaxID=1469245 RepID=UPI0004700B2E|nr:hypothetical protein [Thioalkalivibrio sp. HK1]
MKKSAKIRLEYESPEHRRLPHVVKFSGGRSSGLLLMALLEQGRLDAERGDVVVFNNTTAEHPATYEFVRRCTEECEVKYGIPFLWTEYATYEDCSNGIWRRQVSYRLAKPTPYNRASNPFGYRFSGEVFEEMISQQGFLPSRHSRSCTSLLKLGVTVDFLSEWFAAKGETLRLGHHYPDSKLDDDDLHRAHRAAGGKFERDVFLKRKEYVRSRSLFRPAQRYCDYSHIGSAPMMAARGDARSPWDFKPMRGESAVEFVSLIGLRADEPRRVARVKERNELDRDSSERRSTGLCDGEMICTPLADSGIGKEEVKAFWEKRDFDLRLPSDANLSNCVYCFMKGTNTLQKIIANRRNIDDGLPEDIRSIDRTPSDINWWVDIEEKYKRVVDKRDSGRGRSSPKQVAIGFWGTETLSDKPTEQPAEKISIIDYRSLRARSLSHASEEVTEGYEAMPCDCTE